MKGNEGWVERGYADSWSERRRCRRQGKMEEEDLLRGLHKKARRTQKKKKM